jgi:sterol desaturase/sphingolipid hydroxylase (fatty acid hydroxylase superfamily)
MTDAQLSAWLYDAVYKVVFHGTKALLAPLQRDSDYYWPFLLSTVLIGWFAWRFWLMRGALRSPGFRARFLSREIWWHPSARVDYRYYLINAVVVPVALASIWMSSASVTAWLEQLFGASAARASASEYSILARTAYSVLFFIAYDFGRFVAHSLLHDVEWLWEFHKVHHSAEVLTPVTSTRAHPVDLAVMVWVPATFTGTLTWCFQRWIDPGIQFYTFLGMHALLWAFGLVDNLRHWHVWVSYGSMLNRWLISPAHHQIHHSAETRHHGCNRGFELAVWDRLYGTLYVPGDRQETFRLGLGDGTDGRWQPGFTCGRSLYWASV